MKVMSPPPASAALNRNIWSYRAVQLFLIFGCWTLVSLISLTRHYMEEAGIAETRPIWKVFLIWLTCYYSWAILTPAVFSVAKRWPMARHKWSQSFAIHIPLSFAFTAVSILISHFFYCVLVHKPVAIP